MNKKLLLLAITLPLSLASFSQQQWYKHNLDLTAGGGLQSIQFNPEKGDQKPLLGALIDANYRFMFNKHWGIGAGVGLGFYNARSVYDNLLISQDLVHEHNDEPYQFKAQFHNWKETQRMLDFEVPVQFYYLTPINEKWNFIGDLGAKLGIPVWNKYKIKDGTLKTTGYFEKATNIEYENLPQHGFDTYTYFSGKSDLRKIGATAFIDLGFLRHIRENRSLYLGAYFAYRFTNLATTSDDILYDGRTREYVGVMNSNFVDKAHALAAGVKIGLSFGFPNTYTRDSDKDGVADFYDICPETPMGVKVDTRGCPLDSDKDGVPDYLDQCPKTPEGLAVDSVGCPLDEDGDGVADYLDKCPQTPVDVKVDKNGCPLDSDGDGVADYLDKCPETPADAKVDANGCPLDSDGDGVPDYIDRCPNTNAGTKVDAYGCPDSLKIPRYDAYGRPIDGDGDGIPDYLDNCPEIPGVESNNGCPEVTEETMSILQTLEGIQFETAKSVIRRSYYEILSKVVKIMKENPHYKLIISGHTDNVGESEMNERLSNSRANEVRRYLINRGVDANRLKAVGYGDKKPIADNSTEIGRKKNRRVQFEIDYVK